MRQLSTTPLEPHYDTEDYLLRLLDEWRTLGVYTAAELVAAQELVTEWRLQFLYDRK